MIIYVITKGCYSDYRICAVTEDKERADALVKLFSDSFDNAQIEEYDTDRWADAVTVLKEKYHSYRVLLKTDDDTPQVVDWDFDLADRFDNRVQQNSRGQYWCDITAIDKEHAEKIFYDKLAEYKAEKEGIT